MTNRSEQQRYDEIAAADGDAAISYYTKTAPQFRLRGLVAAAARPRPAVALDLGCGDGVVMERLRPALPGATIIGVDWSAVSLRRALQRCIPAIQADGEAVPLRASSCDLVIMSEVLEHVTDINPLLREAHRVLGNNGRLLVTVPVADWFKCLVGLVHPGRVKFLDERTHRREWAVRRFGKFHPVTELLAALRQHGFAVMRQRGVFYWAWRFEFAVDAVPWAWPLLRWLEHPAAMLPWSRYLGKYLMIELRKTRKSLA